MIYWLKMHSRPTRKFLKSYIPQMKVMTTGKIVLVLILLYSKIQQKIDKDSRKIKSVNL